MDSPNHPVGRTHTLLARAKDALAYGGVFSAIEDVVDYPGGVFPQFADAGEGCRIRDTSGRWYIDWRNGWGSVVLGHRRSEVEAAIVDQLRAGPRLSLMHPLEVEVAERIREMVPCAERVAFGKNGSDATLAAVRVARAYTRRDVILQSGFHGFHDWYQGLRPTCEGIPRAVGELTASFPENDLGGLEKVFDRYDGRVAAVIVEPASVAEPTPGYLDAVRALTHSRGALLVLDEVVTGFRLARGGAQEAYGVVPDVACVSKALANGMPLSAVVGRREVMQVLPRIGYSMTYQGETLSLAAARATLEVHRTEPVAEHLARVGTQVRERFDADARGLGIACALVGIPARLRFRFEPVGVLAPRGLLVLFVQECLKRGVLTDGTLYASYAHDDEAVERSSTALRGALEVVGAAIATRSLERFLHVPVEPGFYVSDSGRQSIPEPVSTARSLRDAIRSMAARLRRDERDSRESPLLFDGEYYLRHNPDVRAAGSPPLVHYLRFGGVEGRNPHPLFDGQYYLANNPDVRESGVNPLVHYLRFGRRAGHDPHPMFDGEYYLANNPDVREAGMNPLVHYVLLGGSEGRDPHPLFDGRSYLADNPGARQAGMNPLCHYLTVPRRLAS